MHSRLAAHAALAALALATVGCASVVQPGFADPGSVHAPAAGATTVSVHGGGIAEVGFTGVGGGGAVRVAHQLEDGFALGGEVFGGGGTIVSEGGTYWTPTPNVAAGARVFVDQRPAAHVLVRLGASGSATSPLGPDHDLSPIALLDAQIAIAPERAAGEQPLVEPYAFAGILGGAMLLENQYVPLPLAGVSLGVGVRASISDAWALHAGALVQSRSGLTPSTLMGFLSPTAIASVGASYVL